MKKHILQDVCIALLGIGFVLSLFVTIMTVFHPTPDVEVREAFTVSSSIVEKDGICLTEVRGMLHNRTDKTQTVKKLTVAVHGNGKSDILSLTEIILPAGAEHPVTLLTQSDGKRTAVTEVRVTLENGEEKTLRNPENKELLTPFLLIVLTGIFGVFLSRAIRVRMLMHKEARLMNKSSHQN